MIACHVSSLTPLTWVHRCKTSWGLRTRNLQQHIVIITCTEPHMRITRPRIVPEGFRISRDSDFRSSIDEFSGFTVDHQQPPIPRPRHAMVIRMTFNRLHKRESEVTTASRWPAKAQGSPPNPSLVITRTCCKVTVRCQCTEWPIKSTGDLPSACVPDDHNDACMSYLSVVDEQIYQ